MIAQVMLILMRERDVSAKGETCDENDDNDYNSYDDDHDDDAT